MAVGALKGPAAASGFTLTVPDTWFEIDVHPATRDASINDLVRARTRGVPELAARRDTIARVLRDAARRAQEGGAVYCGVMVDAVDGEGLTASVTVSVLPPLDPDRPSATAEAIAATLTDKAPRSDNDTWTTVTVTDLPNVGPVARSSGVEDIELPGNAGWIRATVMQTFVPIPASDQIALISCSSPNLVLVDGLLDLFDAVTGTFRFVPGGSTPAAPV